MTADQLTRLAALPRTHALIVGDYAGGYALGVTGDPPAFLLRVEPADVARFPTAVTVDGTEVPVVVEGGFRRPRPQRR
ncbi:MAG: hypothetical protein C0501_04490 [Isosphaera sp.]|nr:hypothetical protein [Isosphaera sp.]